MAKIKENPKAGFFNIPYSIFFPVRQIHTNGVLQNLRDYSLVFKMDNMTVPEFGRILKSKYDKIQLLFSNEGRYIIPTIQADKKSKKEAVMASIDEMKVNMQGSRLDGLEYMKLMQNYLNIGSTEPIVQMTDLISSTFKANINHIICNGTYYRVMFMHFLPDKLDTSLVHKVLEMPGSFLSIHLTPAYMNTTEISEESRLIEFKNASTVQKKINSNLDNGIPYYFAGFYILISAPDMESLEDHTQVLIKNCASMIDTATHNQEKGIVSVLPFGADKLEIKSMISEIELYSFLPFKMGEGDTFEIE